MPLRYKVYADAGSGLVAVDVLKSTTLADASGALRGLLETDETTKLADFSLNDNAITSSSTALSFDLSSLGILDTDQGVTFAIAMSSSRNWSRHYGNGIDDLTVNNIGAVSESFLSGLVADHSFCVTVSSGIVG